MKKRVVSWILAGLLALSAGGNMANTEVKAAGTENGIQARGVWHRPNVTGAETNLAGICSVLDTFQRTGINLVFLETFYHGMAVYRSSFVPYYKGFDAFDYSPYPDYLSAFVAEAGKRGIEVHAWVEDFYIGVEENYFTRHLPDWLMLTKDGHIRQSEGADYGGYLFLDPANPQVRQYLVDFYHELLTQFPDIAGLNLDYIRYPVSSTADDTGYTEAAMAGFAAENGLTFPEGTSRQDKVKAVARLDGKWIQYRADQVTAFVGQVYEMVKDLHPSVLLSTAVFPEQGKSFADKKQDFNTWLKRGYLDIITPMAYYDDIPTLKRALEAMLPGLSACYCYAGISPTYHSLPDQQVLDQIRTTREVGADGYVFFGSQSILGKPQYIRLLEEANAVPAILPHAGAKTLLEKTAAYLEEKLAGEPKENVQSLVSQLAEMAQAADDRTPWKLEGVRKQLRLLTKYNLGTYVSPENLETAKEILDPLYRWIDVKTQRLITKHPEAAEPPQVPEPPAPTEPVTPTEPSASTEPVPEPTVPTEAPTQPEPTAPPNPTTAPTEPPQEPPAAASPKPTKALGLAAAVAALAAAGAACIHAIRKGRKKK